MFEKYLPVSIYSQKYVFWAIEEYCGAALVPVVGQSVFKDTNVTRKY
jgi:hypothetical protein